MLVKIPFVPDADGLNDVIDAIDEEAGGSAFAFDQRHAALARYEDASVPQAPLRGWRHDYARVADGEFVWSTGRRPAPALALEAIVSAGAGSDADAPALALDNAGGLVHAGTTVLAPPTSAARDPRVTLRPLSGAPLDFATLLETTERFGALALAFQNTGAFVDVPAGLTLDAPLQLVFANRPGATDAVFPVIAVHLGENTRATIVERHLGGGATFVCGLVDVRLARGAQLDYVVVQDASDEARMLVERHARIADDGTCRWHLADLGANLARTLVTTTLAGRGARGEIASFAFGTELRHVDLVARSRHAAPETASDVVTRHGAADLSRMLVRGTIRIDAGANGSDARLRSDAMLLAKRAAVETEPALEIDTNDVRAMHAATVGSLDRETLFYAQSRGIARLDAVRMIALAFFEPAIARFPGEPLRDEVRSALDRTIDEATDLEALA